MEAVPRLPMLSFELKISPVCPDFSTPFKRFISKYYGEDGDLYDREIVELENLRNNACRAARDFTGCSILKRYYCQIYSLFNRFAAFENHIGVQCVWADIYSGQTTIGDLDFELACILYNIGALHAELGAGDSRQTADEMKISCTHFQCAVWAFQHLIDDKKLYRSSDLSNDVLQFFVQIMLAQAQECILEKSMLDNRKASIVAKVTAQVVEYYKSAMTMLQQGAMNTSSQSSIIEVVGSKLFKQWKKFVEFKLSYYDSICSLYMGNATEDQQKMGERVAWYELAQTKIQQASQLAKQLDDQSPEINEAIVFVSDVITVKLNNAKKENDFIYHEKIPVLTQLPEVKGASLVKGIPFNVSDHEVAGPDIFARLVPIEAHELASIYSARKDEILRSIRLKIEEKNQELISYMSSLQLEKETLRAPPEDVIPDELVNICAELSLHPDSVKEVQKTLSQLDTVSHDTGKIIEESRELLKDEEENEQLHQKKFGKRPPSLIVVELSKELSKHEVTHRKAIESNGSLWDNFDQHKDDILVMTSSSASKIASILPSNKNVKIDESTVSEMERLFDKIEEMKNQRLSLEDQLVKEMDQDNVLKLVLAHPREEIEKIFDDEIKKYDKIVGLLEQNLTAQQNILRAMTNCNASYADTRKEIFEVQRNRKTRIASLLYTYQVFKELQVNSKKGLEFYQKFQTIVTRLNARIRGVSKVQDEERTQFKQAQTARALLASSCSGNVPICGTPMPISTNSVGSSPFGSTSTGSSPQLSVINNNIPILSNIPSTGAKLKDYLPFMKSTTNHSTATNSWIINNVPGMSQSVNNQPPLAAPLPHARSSFSPSAPSLTPTPPIIPNPQVSTPNVSYVTTPLQQPIAGAGTNLSNYVNNQQLAFNFPVSGINKPTNPTLNSQYSPPPSYTQAISTQVTYSLPGIIIGRDSISTSTMSTSMNNSNLSSTNQYYSNISGLGGISGSYHQQPISSVLPIDRTSQYQKSQVVSMGYSVQPQPSNSSIVVSQMHGNYVSNYPSPLTSNTVTTSSYQPQQYYNNSSPNSLPMQSSHQFNQLYYPRSQVPTLQQNNYNSTPSTKLATPSYSCQFTPVAVSNQTYQPYPAVPLAPSSTYGNIQQHNSYSNLSQQQQEPITTMAVSKPQAQPLQAAQSYCPGAGPYSVSSQSMVSNTGTTTNASTMNPYNQQNHNQMPQSIGYHPSQQLPMVNGHHYQGTTPTNTNQQQQVNNNQEPNITAILEQESKRGWSVLTPTPATPAPVILNNDASSAVKTVATTNMEPSNNSTATISENALPDILATMLSISSNGNNQQQTNTTLESATILNGQQSSSATVEAMDQVVESSTNNNEPKDLLSQFDPLFT